MEEKKGFNQMLNQLTPVQTFALGLTQGLLVLCTIGFFMLLVGGISINSETVMAEGTPTIVNPTPTAAAGQVAPRVVDAKVDHILGNKDAKVTIIEYTDIDCPYCKRFQTTMNEVVEKYGDKVRVVLRQFPLDGLHPNARTKALATECAGAQGKFWEFIDILFDRGTDVSRLAAVAGELRLNVNTFNSCLADKSFASKVQADESDAQKTGGQGTPHSLIVGPNGEVQVIKGAQPLEQIEQMLLPLL
ncbi:MAG: thioredoxin domain-containing protein [Candidatus Magasanikbacteria bacterium]|nr:thioredoxin domain-containing protein [Candidatus Magasanikbacteria bacterium]MBT4071800.1 thioredoxin domain-containing protein [Candidatus Magasanikbacteria bacterium]